MEQFEVTLPIGEIMDFIKTCSFLEEFHIVLDPIGAQKFTKTRPDASALDYGGSVVVNDSVDILGNRRVTKQANYRLWFIRDSKHNIRREEAQNFLYNFEQWVEYANFNMAVPKLSKNDNDKLDEVMWVDNGEYYSEWEGEEASLYLIQLHIQFYNQYIKEEY